jgi:hypothetical protein
MNNTFKLGRSLAQIIPFYREKPIPKDRDLTTSTPVLVIMAVIAIVSLVLILV